MNEHKYILQPYKGISSRHQCPACGHKGEFALYVDTVTRQPLHLSVGRCNRDQKCGYHYTPAEYFKDNPDEKPKDDWKPAYVPVQQKPAPRIEYLPVQYIPTLKQIEKNNLFRFFCTMFGEAKSREVFEKYKVGTSKHWCNSDGLSAVFPQIDTNGNLRQIKVIAYNPITGKRLHKEHPAEKITSTGYVLDVQQDKVWFAGKSLLGNYDANLVQCFFGEHLLKMVNDVSIVESEKTAMIASLYLPNSVWLATGGKNGCRWTSSDVCKVLAGKSVFLYPDLKCLHEWTEKAEALKSHGIKVHVSRYLEEHASDDDKSNGLDIGDYLLKEPLPTSVQNCVHPQRPANVNTGNPPCLNTQESAPLNIPNSGYLNNSQKTADFPDDENSLHTIGELLAYAHEIGIPKGQITINI